MRLLEPPCTARRLCSSRGRKKFMAYDTFLTNLAQRIGARLGQIEAEYNFDNGTEFEVALCELFRQLLPSKYGICRGFAVAANGQKAGDDILIFDCERFPTLRLLGQGQFGVKEQIPVEAVYAYVEVKHTLYLEPSKGGDDGQTLAKAVSQTAKFRSLPRARVPLEVLSPSVHLHGFETQTPLGWPNYRNPLFCAIVARKFAHQMGEKQPNAELISLAQARIEEINKAESGLPDLIVAGGDCVFLPIGEKQLRSPFYLPNESRLALCETNGLALSIGLLVLSWALDSILLGQLEWSHLIAGALNVPLQKK